MAKGVTRLIQGGVTSAQGFVAAGVHCGIKAQKKDLALVVSRVPAAAAGVFTTNKVKAAPVLLDMERVRSGQGQAVLLNSGNANACTGEQGMRDAREMARIAAEHLQLVEDIVYICSTGPIGVPLPMDAIRRGIPEAVRHLGADGTAAAEAILTTDTVSKTGAVQVTVGSQLVTVGGMSKGAGMIHPQMATTLSVLTTDAAVAPAVLNSVLRRAADASFNRITVDGDRSTNDTILIFANGEAGAPEITGPGEALDAFQAALDILTDGLARAIARDGEGATKLVEITVAGAQTEEDAERAARSVANSLLVKTSIHGAMANWGRIMAAVGYSGVDVEPDRIAVKIGPVVIAERGAGVGGPERLEEAGEHLAGENVQVTVDLGLGREEAVVWTCDLSEEYVKENAGELS
ncbi:MAG TPA: bifunctional glutamate N-acetyltransferase/amino-acid acetyltransferase ArgJ [bacterium]|nr:bifunctional glutamate N-acetyltransferase/amino-acid acetyltransferase ArgJ [bacterium]